MKIIFWSRTKVLAQHGNQFLFLHKKLGHATKSLGPVEGQGINANHLLVWHNKFWTGTRLKSIFGLAQNIWDL